MSDNVYTVKQRFESELSKTDEDIGGGEKKQFSNRGRQSKCRGCGEFFNTWEAEHDILGKPWCGTDCLAIGIAGFYGE